MSNKYSFILSVLILLSAMAVVRLVVTTPTTNRLPAFGRALEPIGTSNSGDYK